MQEAYARLNPYIKAIELLFIVERIRRVGINVICIRRYHVGQSRSKSYNNLETVNIKMVSVIAESPNDYSRLSTGYLQEGGYLSTPDWDTLQWSMDSNGLITGSIYWGPFGYNSQGRYLGDRVWPYGMMVLDPAHRDPNTGYYHYDPGEQALATFSCQTYFDGWGDPSHRLVIRQGDRD